MKFSEYWMSKRKISIEDLFLIKYLGNIEISPDQKKCVFTVKIVNREKNKYNSHLWILDLTTKDYYQFTHGDVFDRSPIWSRDGQKIFFIRTKDEDTQIWCINAFGGEAYKVSNLPEGHISELSISNNNRIVFSFRPKDIQWTKEYIEKRKNNNLSNPPRIINRIYYRLDGVGFLDNYQKIWILEPENGKAWQVTEGEFDDYSPVLSNDGSRIFFLSNRSHDPENLPFLIDLWMINLEDNKLQKIKTFEGYKNFLSISPDDKLLCFVGYKSNEDPWVPKNNKLWLINLSNHEIVCLTDRLDRNIGNSTLSDIKDFLSLKPKWSKDGKFIYFLVSDSGNCNLYRVNIDSKELENLTNSKIDIFSYDISQDFQIVSISTVSLPNELFFIRENKLGKITNLNNWIDDILLCSVEEVFFNSFDGKEIQGWIMKPPDFNPTRKYPLVLYIHGGPHAQYGNTFFHEFQVIASQNIIVFYTNPRGSMGREEDFASIIRGDWGNIDYKDIMAGIEFVCKFSFVDRDNLGIIGGSYGGYLTNWTIAHTNLFKCAVTDRSVVDLVSMASTTDLPFMENGYWQGNFWNQIDKLWNQSPLKYAQNINTPLMIIHSEGDLRCPISQAEQLYTVLKRLKKEVLFVRYPLETNHSMSRNGPPDLRIDRLKRILEWFKKWLLTKTD